MVGMQCKLLFPDSMCCFGLHKHICCHTNAFILQINQAKPECGRQTLGELLIRPVQRLPSVALLLNGNTRTHTFLVLITSSLSFPPHLSSFVPASFLHYLLLIPVCNFSSFLFSSPFSSCLSTSYQTSPFSHHCRHKEAYVRWQPRQDNTGESHWVSERSHDVSDLILSFVMVT